MVTMQHLVPENNLFLPGGFSSYCYKNYAYYEILSKYSKRYLFCKLALSSLLNCSMIGNR